MDKSQEEIYKKARKALQLNSCNPLDWNGPSAHEVYERLFVGNNHAARDISFLKSLGVTHLINAAHPGKLIRFIENHPIWKLINIRVHGNSKSFSSPFQKVYWEGWVLSGCLKYNQALHNILYSSQAPRLGCMLRLTRLGWGGRVSSISASSWSTLSHRKSDTYSRSVISVR